MNEEEYLRQRVDDQISWYSKKSRSNQKYFKIISFIEICLSASLVLLAVFLNDSIMKYGSAIIGTTLSILSGIMGLNKFQENWIQYRTTAEWLKKEKYLYTTKSGTYKEGKDFSCFVETVENELSKENSQWVKCMTTKENRGD